MHINPFFYERNHFPVFPSFLPQRVVSKTLLNLFLKPKSDYENVYV